MSAMTPGQRFRSAVCSAEVMIIKAAGEVDLTCGGAAMWGANETAEQVQGADDQAAREQMQGCQVGKRYVNTKGSLEVLCIKPGQGSLASGGELLTIRKAKKLPSSD